jgi:hypothetical protein
MILTAHRTVLIDAIATAASGLLMLAARRTLYPFFGLTSPMLVDLTAIAFLVYAAAISVVAMRPVISRAALMTIVFANIAYVLASLVVLITFWAHLDPIGRVLIIAVTFVVEAFATLQFAAARRAPNATPAM